MELFYKKGSTCVKAMMNIAQVVMSATAVESALVADASAIVITSLTTEYV